MAVLRLLLAGLVSAAVGCGIDTFACSDASQCDWKDGTAVCLADGACAYTDDACPSGLRRSPNAATNPGVCVQDTDVATTTESTGSNGPPPSSSSSTTESDSAETCAALEWFPDADADGFGDVNGTAIVACESPEGSANNADDCNDADSRVRPDHLQCEDNPGLVAWYRLDDAPDANFAIDEAAGSVGIIVGTPSFGIEGAYGTAVQYAAHPDSIEISETLSLLAPDQAPAVEGTIEFWAKPDVIDEACTTDCAHFIVHISDAVGDGFGNNTPDFHIHLNHSGEGSPFRWTALIDGVFGGGQNCAVTGPDVEYDRWTHVAFRWSARSCALLIDGVSVDSATGTAPSPPWTNARIGHPPSRPDRQYQGAIDEVMIFNQSRTDAEIRRDCGRAPCPPA